MSLRIEYKSQSMNQGVPVEIIIMQLKAFIDRLEKDYYDEFRRGVK
jgi:hypothetical protein